MKRSIFIALILSVVVCLFAFSKVQQDANQVIMIRGYILVSLIGGKNVSTIKVYNGSTTEIFELGKINSKAAFDESMNEVLATVNKYGSRLQGSIINGGAGECRGCS